MKKLSRDQMKNLMGGKLVPNSSDSYRIVGAGCTGSVGEWMYTSQDVSSAQCIADVKLYCSSGDGYCINV
jgi:hypothetical protein